MNFHQKTKHHVADMEYLGIHRSITTPLIYQVLWALNIEEIPPFFAEWKRVFAVHAFFNILIVTLLYFGFCVLVGESALEMLSLLVLFWFLSSMLALLKAIRYKQDAESLGLPDWDTYLSER